MLYDVSQEVQESPHECEVIYNHADMLMKVLARSVKENQQLSESMQVTVVNITE